jgi:hypothetical protein
VLCWLTVDDKYFVENNGYVVLACNGRGYS